MRNLWRIPWGGPSSLRNSLQKRAGANSTRPDCPFRKGPNHTRGRRKAQGGENSGRVQLRWKNQKQSSSRKGDEITKRRTREGGKVAL